MKTPFINRSTESYGLSRVLPCHLPQRPVPKPSPSSLLIRVLHHLQPQSNAIYSPLPVRMMKAEDHQRNISNTQITMGDQPEICKASAGTMWAPTARYAKTPTNVPLLNGRNLQAELTVCSSHRMPVVQPGSAPSSCTSTKRCSGRCRGIARSSWRTKDPKSHCTLNSTSLAERRSWRGHSH